MAKQKVAPVTQEEDLVLDQTLRPQRLEEYIGQEQIKEPLRIFLAASKKRRETLEHVLLHSPAGLGKTTLANVIARELAAPITTTSGPALERVGDLASILTNLEDGQILFIDEIHRLNRIIEEVLYPAMEDFRFDIVIGKGPSARTVELKLPRFTLIGATTRAGLLGSPFRGRFGVTWRLDFYTAGEITKILERSAKILGVSIEPAALEIIAERSRQTPRVANRLLKRVRDYAQVKSDGRVSPVLAEKALQMLEVDEKGLEKMDRRILETIIGQFRGGPVGLQSLAALLGEEEENIEDLHEPYLLQAGFIVRTPKGRKATPLAYEHLKLEHQGTLA